MQTIAIRIRLVHRYRFIGKSQSLTNRQPIVPTDIVHRVQTVRPRMDITYAEQAGRIGFSQPQESMTYKGRIGRITMNTYRYAL